MTLYDTVPEEFFEYQTTQIPNSRQNEEAVIGSVLINPEIYLEISQFLKSSDFYIHRNGWIWDAFTRMHLKRIPFDLITITTELDSSGQLSEIGGSAYLTHLLSSVPTSYNAVSYARVVKGLSDRRAGIQYANKIAQDAYNQSEPFDLRDHAMQMLKSNSGRTRRITPADAASSAIGNMVKAPKFGTIGMKDVDNKIGGLFPDELSILAGYQGTGKSALMIHSARCNAEKGKSVLICSLEMSAAQVWMRMACGDLKLDLNQVRSGHVTDDTKILVELKANELAEKYAKHIVIYESPMSPSDILAATILEASELIFIDHLRLISGKPQRISLMEWYNETLTFLRQNVAKSEHTHVMLLHQLNRSSFKDARKPTKHDLQFAGEDDADNIYLLYRKEDEQPVNGKVGVEVIVDKSRFGWTGFEQSEFDLVGQRFYDLYKNHNGTSPAWQAKSNDGGGSL